MDLFNSLVSLVQENDYTNVISQDGGAGGEDEGNNHISNDTMAITSSSAALSNSTPCTAQDVVANERTILSSLLLLDSNGAATEDCQRNNKDRSSRNSDSSNNNNNHMSTKRNMDDRAIMKNTTKEKKITTSTKNKKAPKGMMSNNSSHSSNSTNSSSNCSNGSDEDELVCFIGSTASNELSSNNSNDGSSNDDGRNMDNSLEDYPHNDLECYIVHTNEYEVDDDDEEDRRRRRRNRRKSSKRRHQERIGNVVVVSSSPSSAPCRSSNCSVSDDDNDDEHCLKQQLTQSHQQNQRQLLLLSSRRSVLSLLYERLCLELYGDRRSSSLASTTSSSSLFSCIDPISNRVLDMEQTFSPSSLFVLIWKIIASGMATSTMIMGIMNVAKPTFYLAYLTHWSILFCTMYLLLSLYNTIISTLKQYIFVQQQSRHKQHNKQLLNKLKLSDTNMSYHFRYNDDDNNSNIIPHLRYKITWVMFQLAAHTASGATLMFWLILVFNLNKPLTYNIISNHGIILFVTLIDGMIMNRIPYRINHWYMFILPTHISYVIWTLIHDFILHVGNPDLHDDDPNINDDCIYQNVLEWKNKWYVAASTSSSLIFIVGPVVLIILWYLSIYPITSIFTIKKKNIMKDRLCYLGHSDEDMMMLLNKQYDEEGNSSTAEISYHSSDDEHDDHDHHQNADDIEEFEV